MEEEKRIKVEGGSVSSGTSQPNARLKITADGSVGIGLLPPVNSQIIFFGKYPGDKEEVMRISKEGFFWHGEKVEDKDKIYERFSQWLKDFGY